ncbi:MAG: tRNA (adenosine(37)-N6)-threonylcarbamoyltransferase complex ATPase subunit type 1 TsaE, partial [Chloroflexota bacterium]|nr:tRNA (adenosine(37)-N6)-threonylcarbamoyltransferase complex ATPase subunit type 1 TsaE [Chloroflexota bacterium]
MSEPVTTRSCDSGSVEATRALGRRLGERAQPGDVFLLVGQLGAGKTAFTQGLAAGLGVSAAVNSPTFVLLKEYEGRLKLYHFDLYRLTNPEPTLTQEWAELLHGGGVSVVEWADLAPA